MARFTVSPGGFRLPADTHLGRVHLQIADLARSIGYYESVLGLKAVSRTANQASLAPRLGGEPVLELTELAGAAPVPRRGRLGLFHFALLLPDRADLGRFLTHLRSLGEQPGAADHLVSEALYLTDPDGLGIEVYADRPRAEWRVDGNTLAMATDPLDIASLVRAAGDEPWLGAPAGTRIGHVHLYVADLDQGAAFYHQGLGFDRVVLSFPGALFLSAGDYHHHLGTNIWARTAPAAEPGDARLLEWLILVPHSVDVGGAARSLEAAGYRVTRDDRGAVAVDPWGTAVRIGESPLERDP